MSRKLHPAQTQTQRLEALRELQQAGATPADVCGFCQGLGAIETVKMLRTVWPLSLEEAKEILIRYQTGMSLCEYQGTLLPALEAAFEESCSLENTA